MFSMTLQAPGYECTCNEGYRNVLDGTDQSCLDIDECIEGKVTFSSLNDFSSDDLDETNISSNDIL